MEHLIEYTVHLFMCGWPWKDYHQGKSVSIGHHHSHNSPNMFASLFLPNLDDMSFHFGATFKDYIHSHSHALSYVTNYTSVTPQRNFQHIVGNKDAHTMATVFFQ